MCVRRAVVAVVLVALAGCAGAPTADLGSPPSDPDGVDPNDPGDTAWTGTVVRVVDGDTMEVEFPNGEVDTVRLLGVDTPETSAESTSPDEFEGVPNTDAGRAHLRAWGAEASAFAESELAGEEVTVVTGGDRRGGYGRLLAVLYVDGEEFNERLLTEGYARLYDTEFALRDAYAAAESEARAGEVGLWAFDESDSSTEASEVDDADLPPLPDDGDGEARESVPAFGIGAAAIPVSA
ncbi:nuclease [Halorubrum sp. GN11_10-6_MGM]|uniref:thermonuclease family protein n=1 Tax=Halorubrum sp. GN11_10-6_MGM TaxID=2518112 RepID=UPI0010F5097E|nr:thermonuclease family protein [Halorubrum sp. GN11_10-6_MGM]TKX75091.1 nuclease [Halorubrum sp. GN11_10-6_MGM]